MPLTRTALKTLEELKGDSIYVLPVKPDTLNNLGAALLSVQALMIYAFMTLGMRLFQDC